MTRPVSVAHLTAIDLPPPRLVEAAARAGFDAVGLRLLRVTDSTPGYPLMEDAALMRATRAALRETGLRVNDVEFVRLTPETQVQELSPFLEAGAELGAREVVCAPYDPDLSRLAARLGELATSAQGLGLKISLEFFPWTVVPDLAAAHRLVQQAGPEVGILVDALHFDRSGSTLEQLKETPRERLRLAHLCDARVSPSYSTEALLHTARAERLPPGQGQIDLISLLNALPDETAIGLEVPMTALQAREGAACVLERVMGAYGQVAQAAAQA